MLFFSNIDELDFNSIRMWFIRIWLEKALTSYYSAMEEQVSIIVSIITALLTGGFIILFLENQHVGANVIERYHFTSVS